MKTTRKTITPRTAERLSRAAYDFEELAARLRAEGFERHASGILEIASRLGNMGRSLMDELENGK